MEQLRHGSDGTLQDVQCFSEVRAQSFTLFRFICMYVLVQSSAQVCLVRNINIRKHPIVVSALGLSLVGGVHLQAGLYSGVNAVVPHQNSRRRRRPDWAVQARFPTHRLRRRDRPGTAIEPSRAHARARWVAQPRLHHLRGIEGGESEMIFDLVLQVDVKGVGEGDGGAWTRFVYWGHPTRRRFNEKGRKQNGRRVRLATLVCLGRGSSPYKHEPCPKTDQFLPRSRCYSVRTLKEMFSRPAETCCRRERQYIKPPFFMQPGAIVRQVLLVFPTYDASLPHPT